MLRGLKEHCLNLLESMVMIKRFHGITESRMFRQFEPSMVSD